MLCYIGIVGCFFFCIHVYKELVEGFFFKIRMLIVIAELGFIILNCSKSGESC